MNLSQVSRTAITTLAARAIAASSNNVDFTDPMACLCLERLTAIATPEEKKWIRRVKRLYSGMQTPHLLALARRVNNIDDFTRNYILYHPDCTIINLACGFDTRYWRIANPAIRFIEIDLPEVVELKREILKDELSYELIGCSVLDDAWIRKVTASGNQHFLLLAEGLFMYLPRAEVIKLFRWLATSFDHSHLVLDLVHERYTRGIWKALFLLESKYTWGLETSYLFGIRHAREIESYARGLKVLGESKGSLGIGPVIRVAINDD